MKRFQTWLEANAKLDAIGHDNYGINPDSSAEEMVITRSVNNKVSELRQFMDRVGNNPNAESLIKQKIEELSQELATYYGRMPQVSFIKQARELRDKWLQDIKANWWKQF